MIRLRVFLQRELRNELNKSMFHYLVPESTCSCHTGLNTRMKIWLLIQKLFYLIELSKFCLLLPKHGCGSGQPHKFTTWSMHMNRKF
jgi:hypothetical protein